jgi:hypothetical protein
MERQHMSTRSPTESKDTMGNTRHNVPAKEIANDVGMTNDDFVFVPRINGVILGRRNMLSFIFQKQIVVWHFNVICPVKVILKSFLDADVLLLSLFHGRFSDPSARGDGMCWPKDEE